MDAAGDWIQKALEEKDFLALAFSRGPLGKALQSTPKWPEPLRIVNLPA